MSAPVICCSVPRKSRTGSRISRTTSRCGCCSTDRKRSAVINDGQHRHLTGADPSRPSDREGVQLVIARGSAGSSASIPYLVYLALDAMPSVSPEPFEPPTGPLLTFRPSGGSTGIAATPCWPERQDSTLMTKCAFCKEWLGVTRHGYCAQLRGHWAYLSGSSGPMKRRGSRRIWGAQEAPLAGWPIERHRPTVSGHSAAVGAPRRAGPRFGGRAAVD